MAVAKGRDTVAELFRNASIACLEATVFSPAVSIHHIDDDLMGTRSVENQIKIISDRNADSESHSTDIVADELFRFTLDSRFRRRGRLR